MRIPSPSARCRARIEIIPLIDIIFFLLATFVMVSTSMIKNLGIPVHLPVAATGAPHERENYVSVTITENGEIYYNKDVVSVEELSTRLKNYKATASDPRIFINGDERAFFGSAISVMDEIRKIGISKVAIETRPKPRS